jgi:competence protein ComEC
MLGTVAVHLLRGSRSHPQDGLLAAVAMLVLFDPACIHDLSLQLSVLAVGGIVLFVPLAAEIMAPLRERGPVARVAHAVALMAVVTVCANLLMLPVLALYFSELSGHLWLNLFWLPVLSLAVLPLSFLGLVCSFVAPALAHGVFSVAGLGVEALALGLEFLDGAGWLQATAVLRPSGPQVIGYWVVLLTGCVFLGAKRPQGVPMAFLAIGLTLMTMPSLWQETGRFREQVELTILDTGMSQALYVRGPSGGTILVDGGGGWGSSYDPGRALVGPALAWNHPPRADGVILTHVDADHVRGLFYILDAFEVGWFGWSGLLDHTEDSRRLAARLERHAWPARELRAGQRVFIEPDLWLEVLHPRPEEQGISENETSLVLRLVWKGRGLALLPGDAEKRALGRIVAGSGALEAEVLVLPHHGSASSLLPIFYRRVGARWAVAACGPGNRFGFPSPAVVLACQRAGSVVLTTAEHGAVRFLWRPGEDPVVHAARVGKLFPD